MVTSLQQHLQLPFQSIELCCPYCHYVSCFHVQDLLGKSLMERPNSSGLYMSFSLYFDRIVGRDVSFHAFVISGVADQEWLIWSWPWKKYYVEFYKHVTNHLMPGISLYLTALQNQGLFFVELFHWLGCSQIFVIVTICNKLNQLIHMFPLLFVAF